MRVILGVALVACLATGCTGNQHEDAGPDANTRPSTQQPAGDQRQTNLYGLELKLPADAKAIENYEGPGTTTVNYSTGCSSEGFCPTFTIAGPDFFSLLSLPWTELMGHLSQCNNDASVSGPIAQNGTRSVAGRQAKYYEVRLCPEGTAQETARYWELDDPHLLIQSTEHGEVKVTGLDELLASAVIR